MSIDREQKTKVVHHAETDWMRYWKSEGVSEWESERLNFEHRHENKSFLACQERLNGRLNEWESDWLTFEHRHENKSCSAYRERVNERAKLWEWPLSIDMKTNVV